MGDRIGQDRVSRDGADLRLDTRKLAHADRIGRRGARRDGGQLALGTRRADRHLARGRLRARRADHRIVRRRPRAATLPAPSATPLTPVALAPAALAFVVAELPNAIELTSPAVAARPVVPSPGIRLPPIALPCGLLRVKLSACRSHRLAGPTTVSLTSSTGSVIGLPAAALVRRHGTTLGSSSENG